MKTTALLWTVNAALLPAAAAAVYVRGGGAWWQIALAVGGCVFFEALCLAWRKQPIRQTLMDGSAVVAGLIIGLSLPPLTPWYVAVSAAAFAMVLAKHCYGGLGNNPFNPAMAGYALAFISFPAAFGGWGDAPAWGVIFGGVDAVSTPTPLAAAQLQLPPPSWSLMFPVACAVGGLCLLLLGVADWRLSAGFLLGAWVAGGGEVTQLLMGGVMLAAFFVITDPVTAAVTPRGKWLYALTAGALTVWLRNYGTHTDGIAFAVLVCNMLAPLADKITQPRR